jgi:YbbR domain-containing protein
MDRIAPTMNVVPNRSWRPSRSSVIRLVLSFLLAVLLWGWVTNLVDPPTTRAFPNVPVAVGSVGDNLVVVTEPPAVTVRVTGPESSVTSLSSGEINLALDLNGVDRPGTYDVPIVVVNPSNVYDYELTPNRVAIVVEPSATRSFPITFTPVIPAGSNRRVGQLVPSHTEVTVTGAESVVNSISSVVVEIEVGSRTTDFTATFPVIAIDRQGNRIPENQLTITPPVVEVTVPVRTSGKEVAVYVPLSGVPADGFEYVDRTITPEIVVIDGPPEILSNMTYVETEPIDLTGATQTISKEVPIVGLPQGASIVSPEDGTVTVIVQIRQRGLQQTVPGIPIEVAGLGPGLSAEVTPNEALVVVTASQDQLAGLVEGGLQVIVNVSGLGPGTYQLEPRSSLPPGVEWSSLEPSVVEVTIQSVTATPEPSAMATPAATPQATSATRD